jgi:hypothetical protein
MPYYAMKTPHDTFIAVMEGMRFEHDLLLDSVKGVYAMYPSWNIAEIGFPPYEDMTVVFCQLPLAADYNEMAKVYRSYKFTHDPAVRTLKERIKDRSELQKLADSIALRQTHTGKPWHPPSLRGRPRARLHRGRACKLHRLLYLLAALEQRRHRLPRAKRHARVQWRLERRQGVQSVPEARLGDIHARRPREGLEARLPRVPLYRRVLGRATLPLLRSEAPREQEGADARADRSGEAVPAALWRIRERVLHGPQRKSVVDRFVPFFELAFHDVVLSNPDKITQEVLDQDDNLILVEYGGRPIFYGIGKNNLAGVVKAWQQFKGLRHLMTEEMMRHQEIAPGIVRVDYANGEAIMVNRSDKPFAINGVTVPVKDFRLLAKDN